MNKFALATAALVLSASAASAGTILLQEDTINDRTNYVYIEDAGSNFAPVVEGRRASGSELDYNKFIQYDTNASSDSVRLYK
ncbi:MAG: hypothetical protein JKY49_10970 [Cohaesibacteraceae bacterium]|nr:hypothetical protein [Cohaesibacteraceae bacterium]MBL4875067.1 hypothetical protein [Cohaesibacteraceae bacterium]